MKRALMSSTAFFAIVVWGITATAPVLRAQQAVQTVTGQKLDDDGLRQMLDNMGMEPKKLNKGFLIAIKRDGWTYSVQLVLSSDGSKMGMNANLGAVENADTVPAETWKNLLISNGEIDPSSFYLDKPTKKLYLHRTLDNRAIDAPFLRKQIDSFCSNIKETVALWKFTK